MLPVAREAVRDVLRPAAYELRLLARGPVASEGMGAARGIGAAVRGLLVRGGWLKSTVDEAPPLIRRLLAADQRFVNFRPVGDMKVGKVSGDVVSFTVPARETVSALGQFTTERAVNLEAEFNLADRTLRFLKAAERAPLPGDSAPSFPSDPVRHWNNFRRL
ncbi:MAG: hypothetical protein VKP57_09650 [Candidatus Sericytochromatia bacterium]|nr:hypothetical protein [Candidatus Sericytochromatia bacterium]